MTGTTFNINPFYDDYDPSKGFYRILYRPEFAVQARELTQQQTILQEQITRFGNHIFEDGSIVTGAQHFLDLDVTYLRLQDQFAGQPITVTQYADQIVTGQTSGAVGRVIHVEAKTEDGTDPATLFVKEISGTFQDGEQIVAADTLASALLETTGSTGKGSITSINEGVYYVNGFFVFVNPQLVVLDKYGNTPSYRIGLTLVEEIITEEDDPTLLDPAQGAPNFTAPGAHRFKIDLQLQKKGLDIGDDLNNNASAKFIEILRVENGIRTKDVKYSIYSDLEDSLARRTFDESGNYTVEPFQIDFEEDATDTSKLSVSLEPGKAYIKGYEHRTIVSEKISVDKGRDTQEVNNFDINAQFGNYALVTNLQGSFDPGQMQEVQLLSSDIAGTTGGNFTANTIGTAFIRQLEYDSGGNTPYTYRMYLFDLSFDAGFSFKDVQSIWVNIFSDGIAADIDAVNGQDVSGNSLLFGTAFNNLLFRTPNEAVETLRPNGNTDTDFQVQRTFSVNFISGLASINVSGVNTLFGATGVLANAVVRENYHVVLDNVTNAGGTGLSSGDVVDMTVTGRSVSLSSGTQIATFDIGDGSFAATGTILATVNLNEKGEKVKTLTTTTGVGLVPVNSIASLGRSDVFRIIEIRDTGDANAIVTEKFDLDTGQRDNFYDHGSIILKAGETVVGPLDVDYEFFAHSGSGYFSVDSYTAAIAYEEIPTYTTSGGEVINLRDSLDFRPRRIDFGTDLEVPAAGADIPKPNTNVNADYIFFLPRIDKIVLRANREFDVIRGVSSLNPVTPADDEDAMSLYTIKVPAYTFDVNNVEIQYIDNRRYTMRDIGIIETRLNNVEYYTALSFLEKETQDLVITDTGGIEQFKSGILVDSFTGHGVGDVINPDYACAIDFENRELRPSVEEDAIDFTLDTGSSLNVQQTGDIITLSYSEEVAINQPLSNTTVTINPFNVSGWTGTVELSPEVDSWFDTETNPKVVTNTEGENDAWLAPNLGFGTQWNDWISNWAGQQINDQEDINEQTGSQELNREATDVLNSNSRTQLRARFSPASIQRKVGTRTANESIVPFIRAQQISFEGRGLRPNTIVFPFFDGVDVSVYCTPTGGALGDPLVTDAFGTVTGTFDIPNDNTLRFKTGERLFRLTDNSTDALTATTAAERRFLARGLINSREETIISTRAPIIRRRANGDSVLLRDPVSREQISSNNVLTEQNWIDPLAQLFTIDSNVYSNGIFINKLNLFFATKDDQVPVTVEIRPTVNSYPHSSLAVPFSQVTLNANEVNVSEDGSIGTEVLFDSPVFLAPGQYAIIVTTNSNQYTLYMGEQGELQTNTSLRITPQPFVGGLYESQNIDQYNVNTLRSIKFSMSRCVFSNAGESVMLNVQPSTDVLADVLYVLTSQLRAAGTNVTFSYKAKDLATGNVDTDWIPLLADQNYEFDSQKIIEAATADTLQLRAVMETVDQAVSPVIDLQRLTAIAVQNLINDDVTDEDLPSGGNAEAVYLTRRVTLQDSFDANGLRVFLTGYKSSQNNIRVYYKVLNSEDGTLFDDRPWVELAQLSPSSQISVNENDYREIEFGEDGINYDGFTTYKTFAIKVVMTSIDSTDVPRVRDLRAVAVIS